MRADGANGQPWPHRARDWQCQGTDILAQELCFHLNRYLTGNSSFKKIHMYIQFFLT